MLMCEPVGSGAIYYAPDPRTLPGFSRHPRQEQETCRAAARRRQMNCLVDNEPPLREGAFPPAREMAAQIPSPHLTEEA